jgi:hypothetical protein
MNGIEQIYYVIVGCITKVISVLFGFFFFLYFLFKVSVKVASVDVLFYSFFPPLFGIQKPPASCPLFKKVPLTTPQNGIAFGRGSSGQNFFRPKTGRVVYGLDVYRGVEETKKKAKKVAYLTEKLQKHEIEKSKRRKSKKK